MEGIMARRHLAACAVLLLLATSLSVKVSDGAAADTSACPSALTKLLPCLPYSQGTAQVPAKDCCTNLATIHESEPQCLCALIAASVNGSAGLPKMNTTLALTLGPACGVATKPSRCPALLGLAPTDPLVKIFQGATSGAPAGSPASNSSSTPASSSASSTSSNGGSSKGKAVSSLGLLLSTSLLVLVAACTLS